MPQFYLGINRMNSPRNTTRRVNTNNSAKTNNSTKKRRRGAITPNNARRIRGQFQKPPLAPRPKRTPGVLYMNNLNIGNLTMSEMNNMLRRMG